MVMLASSLAALLLAQATPSATTDEPPQAAPSHEDIAFADFNDRMTVAVSIAGRGPFAFVVDTGAERTVVSRDLPAQLPLPPRPAAGPEMAQTPFSST